jgi:hypothetical protein
MQIISRRARLVCVTVAILTSSLVLGSTLFGLTSTSWTPLVSAQVMEASIAFTAGC